MPRNNNQSKNQQSPASFPGASEIARTDYTRTTRQKAQSSTQAGGNPAGSAQQNTSMASRPSRVVSNNEGGGGGAVNPRALNQQNVVVPTGVRGPVRRGSDMNNGNSNPYQSFGAGPSSAPVITEYGFPPMAEHLSEKEKRQPRNMEEFDTIVVSGRKASIAGTDHMGSSSPFQSSIVAPVAMSGKRGNRGSISGAVVAGNGGNSGRTSRNSTVRGGTASASRGGKSRDTALGRSTGVADSNPNAALTAAPAPAPTPITPNIRGSDITVLSKRPSTTQFPPQLTAPIATGSGRGYQRSTQQQDRPSTPLTIASGPQEGVIKMKDDKASTPQWSETKTKVSSINLTPNQFNLSDY